MVSPLKGACILTPVRAAAHVIVYLRYIACHCDYHTQYIHVL